MPNIPQNSKNTEQYSTNTKNPNNTIQYKYTKTTNTKHTMQNTKYKNTTCNTIQNIRTKC